MEKKLVVILGPTASGKTELSIKLAKNFNGEIVSADSRQIYKEMDIGTAKPKFKKRSGKCLVRGIVHHLIDVIAPNKEFNVAIFKKLAIRTINDILKRKKLPFLVGGTALYLQSVIENIEFPKVPPQKKLRKKLEKKSLSELFKLYQKLDPEGAKFIERKNKRRLIRAIEVCQITKRSFFQQRKKGESLFNCLLIGLKLEKKDLEKRIKERVKKMIKEGLEKEVEKLTKKYGWKRIFLETIGYQEWQDYFKKKITKKEVENQIIKHTLQFVKHQMTWFKKNKKIHWVKTYSQAEKLVKNFLK